MVYTEEKIMSETKCYILDIIDEEVVGYKKEYIKATLIVRENDKEKIKTICMHRKEFAKAVRRGYYADQTHLNAPTRLANVFLDKVIKKRIKWLKIEIIGII